MVWSSPSNGLIRRTNAGANPAPAIKDIAPTDDKITLQYEFKVTIPKQLQVPAVVRLILLEKGAGKAP